MTCRLFETELSSYLDGELAAARKARLEAHLQVCPHCRAELEAMSGIGSYIRAALGEVDVSHDFDHRVLRTVGYLQVTGRRKHRTLTKPLVVVAMSLLALLGLIRHFLSQPVGPPLPAPQPAAVVAPASPGVPVAPDRDRR